MRRIAILADTRHHVVDGDAYVLTRVAAQLEQLGALFDGAIACVPVHPGPPPANFEPYLKGKVDVRPLAPAGGTSWRDKAVVAARAVSWIPRLRRVAKEAGFVHFRCPCNVALVALLVVPPSIPWYAMYAGNWDGYPGEPWSYRLQRWLLRRRRGGVVTAYTTTAVGHVVPFFSPTHTAADLAVDAEHARPKLDALRAGRAPAPLRVLSVGHLTANKNQRVVIEAVARARAQGVDVELDIAGDGELRDDLHALVNRLGVGEVVRLRGLLSRDDLRRLYWEAHVNVLVSRTEGFPKAVLEGMAAGAVPVLSRFPMAAELAGDGTRGVTGVRGVTVAADDVDGLAAALVSLAGSPERLAAMAEAGLNRMSEYSLERFRTRLAGLFSERWPALFND